MTLPDLQACPNCGQAIRVRPKNCPGCGYVIRAYRVRVTVGDRVNVLERVVAIPPEHADKFQVAGDVVEELLPRDASQSDRLRVARERLDRASARSDQARAEDNALKSDDTRRAREAAVLELELATRKLAELVRKEFGL